MQAVPRVDLTDPSVEPTDEELEALMSAVCENMIEDAQKGYAEFLRRLDNAINGRGSDVSPQTRIPELAD